MNGFDAVSKIIAPVFVKYDCYGKDRSALVQLLGTESHPQLDALCYSLPVRTGVDMTSKFDWKCRLVDGEPGTGAVGIDEALAAQDENWSCTYTRSVPVLWHPRFNCRDWTLVYQMQGTLPVHPHTFTGRIRDGGVVHTEFNLNDSSMKLSLILTGNRVDELGCEIEHPFHETMVYALDIDIEGVVGSMDLELGWNEKASKIFIEGIDAIELAPILIGFDTLTNNQLDVLLTVMSGSIPVVGTSLFWTGVAAWVIGVDVFDVFMALRALILPCGDIAECSGDSARDILEDNPDLLLSPLNTALSAALDLDSDFDATRPASVPVAGTTISQNISLALAPELSGFFTSGSDDAITSFWDVTVASPNATSGTCTTGLTPYVPTPLGAITRLDADLVATVPFDLVAHSAETVLRQLNFCGTPLSLGAGVTAQIAARGSLAVRRGSAGRVDLVLPMSALLTASVGGYPAATNLQFNLLLSTLPALGPQGTVALTLVSLNVSGLSGAGSSTTNAGLQAAIGGAIASSGMFPMPLVQRATPYIARHVFLEPATVRVDTGSFSLGASVRDGSEATDLAVARLVVGVHSDERRGGQWTRRIPIQIPIENRDADTRSPPTDVTIQVGDAPPASFWVPELAPGASFVQPFELAVPLDATGTRVRSTGVSITADPTNLTMIDSKRSNNVDSFTVNDAWFAPDYHVEVGTVRTLAAEVSSGSAEGSVGGASLSIPVTIENIGTLGGSATSIQHVLVLVNGERLAQQPYSGIALGATTSLSLDVHVSAPPRFDTATNTCEYEVRVETDALDSRRVDNSAQTTVELDHGACQPDDEREPDLAEPEIWRDEDEVDGDRGEVDGEHGPPIRDRLQAQP